jgi:hypothetical protein
LELRQLFEKSWAKTFGVPTLYLVNGAQQTIALASFGMLFGGAMWASTPTDWEVWEILAGGQLFAEQRSPYSIYKMETAIHVGNRFRCGWLFWCGEVLEKRPFHRPRRTVPLPLKGEAGDA